MDSDGSQLALRAGLLQSTQRVVERNLNGKRDWKTVNWMDSSTRNIKKTNDDQAMRKRGLGAARLVALAGYSSPTFVSNGTFKPKVVLAAHNIKGRLDG